MTVAITEIVVVGQLSWTLYNKCYKVARGAPQEFQHLLSEVTMLSQAMRLLQEEVQKEDSTVMKTGEYRIQTVNEVVGRVGVTLKVLDEYVNRYAKLGHGDELPTVKKMWRAVKWSVDAADLDALRNQVIPGPPNDCRRDFDQRC